MYLAQALGFAGTLASRRFLGPASAGVLGLITIISNYATLTHFGLVDGGNKLIPFYIGKSDTRRAASVANAMWVWTILSSCLITLLVFVSVPVFGSIWPRIIVVGLLFTALTHPLRQIATLYSVIVRSQKCFKSLSKLTLGLSAASLTLTLWLVRLYGLYGAFSLTLIIAGLNVICWRWFRRWIEGDDDKTWQFKWVPGTKVLPELFVAGFPIMIYSLLFNGLQSIDSLIVGKFAGITALGYYNLASIICLAVWNAPNGFSAVMFPRYQERLGQTNNVAALRGYTLLPIFAFAGACLPAFIGTAWLVLPAVISRLLPAFQPSVKTGEELLLGTYFLCLTPMPIQFAITTGRFTRLICTLFGSLLIAGAGDYLVLRNGYGIQGVALWTSIVFFLFFGTLVIFGLQPIAQKLQSAKALMIVIACFAYLCAALWVVTKLEVAGGYRPQSTIFSTALWLAVFWVSLVPLFFLTLRRVKAEYRSA